MKDLENRIAGRHRDLDQLMCPQIIMSPTYAIMRHVSTTLPLCTAKLMPLRKTMLVIATPIKVALNRSGTVSYALRTMLFHQLVYITLPSLEMPTHLPQEVRREDIHTRGQHEKHELKHVWSPRALYSREGEPTNGLNAQERADSFQNRKHGGARAQEPFPPARCLFEDAPDG